MGSVLQYQRFLWILSLGVLLAGCGGGSDESGNNPTNRALASDTVSGNADTQNATPKRKAKADQRKGVTAVVATSDGSAIGVARADGSVRLLDPLSALDKKVLKAPNSALSAGLVFSRDARYLISVGRDSVAQFWSVENGEARMTLHGHEHALRSVAMSRDGSILATGGEETRVMVWDGATGRLKRILGGAHSDFVTSVSVSADGRLIASGDANARILIWEVATGKLLYVLRGHADEVTAVAFCADSPLLASAGEDGKVILWDTNAGLQVGRLVGMRAPVRSLSFSADGGLLAGGAQDGKVLVWETATRSVSEELSVSSAAVNTVAFDADKPKRLVVGSADDGVFLPKLSERALKSAGCGTIS